jgi:hypothetical protein
MNKKEAKAQAMESTRTYLEIKELISKCDRKKSTVNANLSIEEVLSLYMSFVEGKCGDSKPDTISFRTGRLNSVGMSLMNILMDCG